jgi:hypothetical protein
MNQNQVIDKDFLSEAEGDSKYLFRDGYGINENLILDGYVSIEDVGLPDAPVSGLTIYYKDGYLSSVDAGGTRMAYSSNGATAYTLPDALSLELQYYLLSPSFYTELSYNESDQVIDTDIWTSPAKTTHIFNKHLTWINNQVVTILITRITDGKTLQKDLIYDGYGKIINVTRTYTP